MAYVKRERSKAAIERSAKKVSRKARLAKKEAKLQQLEESGLRPTLASKPKQRISLEAYMKELQKFPHASEYTLLSEFKLFTPKCIAHYRHDVCGTTFNATPANFELKKSLCPKCITRPKDMGSETIDQL